VSTILVLGSRLPVIQVPQTSVIGGLVAIITFAQVQTMYRTNST